MEKHQIHHMDIEIDKLTNCIINRVSEEIFQTDVTKVIKKELINVNHKTKWKFNWKNEFLINNRIVYKLTIVDNTELQGLVSIAEMADHVYLHLVESAPTNYGAQKIYEGVGGNLIAFCCKLSFDKGNNGIIGFKSKTGLVNHYIENLGATHIGSQNMIIYPKKALSLINKYYSSVNIY